MSGYGIALSVALLAALLDVPKEKPKTAPAVPVEVREQFFKAQSEALQAQDAAKSADAEAKAKMDAFQATVKKAQDSCGTDYQLSLDKDRDLTCVAKPKPAEEVPAKK